MTGGIIDAAIGRARTVLSLVFICIVFGLVSYATIPKEADPDIPIPVIFVSLVLNGISPEDGERLLVRPMEKELQSIEGLKEMRSFAAQGFAGVILEFDVNFDKDKAVADVRDKVDIARAEIPADAEEPVVEELNVSTFPILVVTLAGDVPERSLYQLALRLQDRLEALGGVLEAQMVGQREELLEVIIEPAKLETYDISQAELINAITQNNRLVAAGSLDTGEGRFSVKVPGLFETREDVLNLPIKVSGDGVVTLSDIADIRRTFKDRNGYATFNGEPAIALQISKRVGENIIETVDEVRSVVADVSETWPEGIKIGFTGDASSWVYRSLNSLQGSIMTAISLVMIVIVAALGLRSGILVGFAIPTSFLLGFIILMSMGLTVNMMIMFGLVLSVGILVDGAIVVVEYADRKMAEGLHRREAYALAAKRMFWPICTSTLTTLAAFFPMLFWPGVTGKFMSYLPITLIVILTASLIVALIFLPVLGAVLGRSQARNTTNLKALAGSEDSDLTKLTGLTGSYVRLVERVIRRPALVLISVMVLLASIVAVYWFNNKGTEFFVEVELERAYVIVSARGNMSVDEARDLVLEVEDAIKDVKGIKDFFVTTQTSGGGAGGTMSAAGELPADMIGQILLELKPYGTRPQGKQILEEIRRRTAQISGIKVEVREEQQGPSSGKDIQLQISAADFEELLAAAATIVDHMENGMTDVIEIDDSRPLPGIEWELQVDRERAGRFGADIVTIGATVQLVTNGILIDEYRPDDSDEEIEIRARFPEEYRSIEQLDRLRIRTNDGLVPISNFVRRVPGQRVNQINRVDGRRIIEIRANTAPGVLPTDKVAELRDWLTNDAPFGRSIDWKFGGEDEESQEASAFLGNAMLAALFLMFIILLTQFNNFYHSFLILSTVVLSTVGVLVGMLVMGQTFSVIMTGTGIVALAGIVVNNNIVLIDTYQRMLREGFAVREAVLRTTAQRFRPVLLTTVTTMCGLLPMMFGLNIDYVGRDFSMGGPVALWWVQLATAVVFGLGFATILTLMVTPALLAGPTLWWDAITRWYASRPTGREASSDEGNEPSHW